MGWRAVRVTLTIAVLGAGMLSLPVEAHAAGAGVAQYANHLVQWDGDTAPQKTSWYVTPDLKRLLVPDSTTFDCLVAHGAAGPDLLAIAVLDQIPDQTNRWAPCGDTMGISRTLRRGMSMKSGDGRFKLVLQGDGNLVLYGPSGVVWSNNRFDTAYAIMQNDGNFVTYRANNKPNWSTGTGGTGGNRLVVQSDGNLVIYSPAKAVWASKATVHPAGTKRSAETAARRACHRFYNRDFDGVPYSAKHMVAICDRPPVQWKNDCYDKTRPYPFAVGKGGCARVAGYLAITYTPGAKRSSVHTFVVGTDVWTIWPESD